MARQGKKNVRRRLRDLGLSIGRYEPGPLNAITDVEGVKVGHTTLISGRAGPLEVGRGPVRTGVTAILPSGGNVFEERVVGGSFILNGAGEMTGLIQVQEWGLLETPILLTNTLAVGTVSDAAVRALVDRFPGIGMEHDVIIPVVGECDDSFLNDISGGHVRDWHVFEALDSAKAGPVEEGSVGSGTGMVTCDLKGGIGTSSRRLPPQDGGFTIGVLVMTNFGRLEDLRVDGVPVGSVLAPFMGHVEKRRRLYGSIIVVLATDAPLSTHQLNRVCRRAALGIGRVGSYAAHGSGEIIIGFSTSNKIPREHPELVFNVKMLGDRFINPFYEAAIEGTEEAILNALCMASDMDGVNGRHVPALPLDALVDVVGKHRRATAQAAAQLGRARNEPASNARAPARKPPTPAPAPQEPLPLPTAAQEPEKDPPPRR